MKRRSPPRMEPPARLLAFKESDWLPQVNPDDYDPEAHRGISNGVRVGEPGLTRENWRRGVAFTTWSRARMAWQAEHGWPDEKDSIELLREAVEQKRRLLTGEA